MAVTLNLLWDKSRPILTVILQHSNSITHPRSLNNFASSPFLVWVANVHVKYLCILYFVSTDLCRWTCSSYPFPKAITKPVWSCIESKLWNHTHAANDPPKTLCALIFHLGLTKAYCSVPWHTQKVFTSRVLLPACFGQADWYSLSARGQVTWKVCKTTHITAYFNCS